MRSASSIAAVRRRWLEARPAERSPGAGARTWPGFTGIDFFYGQLNFNRVLEVTFRAPDTRDQAEIAEAQRIMAAENFTFAFGYVPGDDFPKWLELMASRASGKNVAPGWVAATFELAIVENRIAGRLSVRHALNDFLFNQGGHIGYCVLPKFRGRGVGKQMLQRGLELTAALGIQRVLVTCDEDNAASRRIIEGAGGAYESSYVGGDVKEPIRRYWFG